MTRTRRSRALPPARPANTNNLVTAEPTAASTACTTSPGLVRYPAVHCSLIAPAPGRTRWGIITDQCVHCDGRHIHFARSAEQAGGIKRAGCRRGRYWLVIARTYTPKAEAA